MAKNPIINQILQSACGHLNQHLSNTDSEPKIRSYEDKTRERSKNEERPVKGLKTAKSKKGQKIKNWIALNLWYWCRANGYALLSEQRFDEVRKWKVDWMICGLKCAIEYEGLNSEKSRHTTKTGYTNDTEKYNAAQSKGLTVLRYTALNYKTLLQDLEKLKR